MVRRMAPSRTTTLDPAVVHRPLNPILTCAHRRALVCDLGLTFAATVGHIVSAIRKLAAAATQEETTRKLYRGVRGELARGFWLRDDMGMVCATDTAFMSTSRNRGTPIHYMSGEANVLWELAPREESDAAYHCGADISMLDEVTPEFKYAFCLHANETLLRLEHTPKLVIAALGGHCVGGGKVGPSDAKNTRRRREILDDK